MHVLRVYCRATYHVHTARVDVTPTVQYVYGELASYISNQVIDEMFIAHKARLVQVRMLMHTRRLLCPDQVRVYD